MSLLTLRVFWGLEEYTQDHIINDKALLLACLLLLLTKMRKLKFTLWPWARYFSSRACFTSVKCGSYWNPAHVTIARIHEVIHKKVQQSASRYYVIIRMSYYFYIHPINMYNLVIVCAYLKWYVGLLFKILTPLLKILIGSFRIGLRGWVRKMSIRKFPAQFSYRDILL